jgi:hypothetical protein
MRKGDLVKVHDFSYSVSVEDGGFSGNFNAFHPRCRDKFVVVETGCVFPRTSRHPGDNHNDTVIQSVDSGLVAFIEERFLRPVTHTIIIDGKTIKLSHESYKNLKEQLI